MMTALLVFTTRVSMYSTVVFFYYLCTYIATALSNIELRMISLLACSGVLLDSISMYTVML